MEIFVVGESGHFVRLEEEAELRTKANEVELVGEVKPTKLDLDQLKVVCLSLPTPSTPCLALEITAPPTRCGWDQCDSG